MGTRRSALETLIDWPAKVCNLTTVIVSRPCVPLVESALRPVPMLANTVVATIWSTIEPHVPNLVSTLKAQGYTTGMFGKNHLFTYGKLDEVWDTCSEVCLGNYDHHPDYKQAFSSFELHQGS